MRPNWFFAFPLDGRFVLEMPDVPRGFRLYHPDDVHLTLAFLGPCGDDGAERALAALDEGLSSVRPRELDVSLGEVVPMGSRRAYSALSALLANGRSETETCIAELRDGLTMAASGRREKRAPKAHVTIARPFRAKEEQRAAGLTWAAGLELGAVRATLDRIALYTWSADRRERLFRVVAERALSRDSRAHPARPGHAT